MKKEAARRNARRASPILEALEPRVLLSADLPGIGEVSPDRDQDLEPSVEEILADAEAALVQVEAAANASSAAQAQDATPAESSNEAAGGLVPPSGAGGATRHELVVVDPDVPAYEQLISGLKGQGAEGTVFDVVMLDPQRQGLGQISEILAARGGLDAVHLISHGGDGEFRLGGDGIDLAVLQQDADAVRAWGNALRGDADILIYGCDLASTAEGELLVDILARLTGADVAASDDLTGHASLGGNWDLEYQAGVIDARVAVSDPIQGTWMATLDAPVISSDGGGPTAALNGAENQTGVTTVTATDADAGDTPTFSLSGGSDAALFGIDTNTGVLSFNTAPDFESATDANADGVYEVEVTADDGHGGTDTQSISVTVTDVNDDPVFTSPAAFIIPENQALITTLTATDQDVPAQTVEFAITGGPDALQFALNPTSGVLVFVSPRNFEAPADANGDNVYEVEITATDGNGGSSLQTLLATVTDQNDNTPVVTPGQSFAVDEHSANGTSLGQVVATDADAVGTLQNWTITFDSSGGMFAIDSGTGELTVADNSNLDFDSATGYTLFVRVSDGVNTSSQEMFTISVNDVNVAPSFTSAAPTAATEELAYSYNITTTDPDSGTSLSITAPTLPAWLSLSDNGDGTATLSGTPGNAAVGGNTVVLAVFDGALTTTQNFTINVANVNDVPVIDSDGGGATAVVSTAENQTGVTTVTATDVDAGDTPTFSLSGGVDAALFGIDPNSGVLSFNTAPDFETATDANSDGVYEVEVTVDDGHGGTDTQSISVTVTDVNEAPSFTSVAPSAATEEVAYSYNITTTDPDSGTSLSITAPTLPAWLSLSDNGNGTATLSGTPDNAAVGGNNVVLAVFDGALTTTQNFTINVANVNDVPVIDSDGGGATAAVGAAENQTGVTTVTATDVDAGDTPTFSLSGGVDAALFGIDPNSGVLSFNTAPDFETATDANSDGVYEVEVTVDDGHGGTDTQSISVTVTDVNEAPSFTSVAPSAATEEVAYSYNITTTDPDSGAILSITAPTLPAWLSLSDNGNGTATLSGTPDNAAVGGNNVVLAVFDGALTTTQNFTINVANVNDVPVIDSDGGGATAVVSTAENQTGVTTVTATDVDAGDTPTFSLSGGVDAALFGIDPNSGVLSFNTAPDFETATDANSDGVYEVEVTVDDGHGGTDTQSISVTVTDVNEAPSFTSVAPSAATEEVAYSYNITTTDPDSGTSLSITAPTLPAWLSLSDNGNGTATLSGTPDNAAVGGNNVVLAVFDGALTTTQNFTINVANVNDVPVIDSDGGGATAVVSTAENQTGVTTVTATDVDAGDTPTFSLSGGSDAARFGIDPNSGILSFNTAPDFETATDADADGVYEVEVRVDDGHGGTDTQAISVSVTDVNDAPVANDDPGAFSADILSLNPVSYWRLGETSGTSVTDIGSVGNATGTYNGPSLGESDPINGDPDSAAGFNRTELDYIEIAHDDAYLLDEGTVQLWFNANDLAQDQTLFSKDSSGLDTGGHLTIRVLTDGRVETRLQSTSADNFVYSGAGSVTAGNWHHIAFTFGSGGMQLYLDGNRVDTNGYTGGLGTTSGGTGNFEPIAIGAGTRTSGDGTVTPLNDYFDGRIDEVVIFGTALSGADINRLNGGALQHYTLAEDTSLSVAAAEGVLANDFDEEGDPLTAILVSGPTKAASFTLNADGSFNYTPIADFSGTDSFTYRADDGTAGSNVATVTISVANVNDVPVIDSDGGGATAVVNAAENQTGVTTVTATDVDDTPTFSLSGGSDAALFDIDPNTGVLSFNTAPDFETATDADADGVYEVEVRVDDGHGGTDTQSISVSVTDVNEAPGFTSAAPTAATEELAYSYSITTTDPDSGTSLSITAPTLPAWLSLSDNGDGTATLSGTPGNAAVGGNTVVLAVFDGALTTTQNFTINVANVNDVPVIDSDGGGATAAVGAAENQTGVTTITATDVDAGDTPTFSLSGGSDAALFDIDPNTGVLSFNTARDFETATDADADGVYEVEVRVDDGHGGTDTQSISVSVTDVNEAPGFTSAAPTAATEELAYSYSITTTDPDSGTSLSITAPTLPAWLSLSDNGDGTATLSGTPGNAAVGGNTVVLAVFDGALTTTQNFTINVANVNDVPVIDSDGGGATAAVGAAENQTGVTTVTATDVDAGDTPTFSLSGGSDAALFDIDPNTGVLSFNTARDFETATDADADGVYEVEVRVDDGHGGTDTQAISVSVTDVNEAPGFTSAAPTAATEELAYSYSITTTDPDSGTSLSITAPTLPAWLSLSDNGDGTATLSGTPGNAAVGGHNVVLAVFDGALTTTQNFTISVANVNDDPVFTSPAAFIIPENQVFITTLTATDQDIPAQTVEFAITGGPDALQFALNPTSGVLVFVSPRDFEAPADANGDNLYEVEITATDGNGGSSVQTLLASVTEQNDNTPVVTPGQSFAVDEHSANGTSLGQVVATDADAVGTLQNWTITFDSSGGMFAIDSGTGELTVADNSNLDFDSATGYTLFARVSDGVNTSSQEILTISVNDVNVSPVNGGNITDSGALSIVNPNSGETRFVAETTDEPRVAGEAPVGEDAVLQAQAPLSLGGGLPETGEAQIANDGATDLLQPIVPEEFLLEVLADRDAERTVHSQIDKPDVRTAQRLLEGLGSLEKVASVAAMTEVGGHGSQTEAFWHDLEQMAQDMERAAEEDGERLKLSAETAAGVTLSLTAGVVSWVMRAGSLVASFLTVMPTWRHFDPMPILSAEEPEVRATADDDPEGSDEPAESKKVVEETQVEALFDR